MNQALTRPIPTGQQGYGERRRWLARIDMHLEPRAGRTALPGLRHEGPLRVQRPFYPEGPVCHIYLLHPPGGLVSGDQLVINAHLQPGSEALITTPSAGKIYKGDSCGVAQQQQVNLTLQGNSTLEWLPQETILYDGALGHSQTRVDLEADSRFIGWEIICLGRPANQIRFQSGYFLQQMAIYRDALPLLLEKQHLQADSPLAHQAWGLQGYPVVGNLYACGFSEEPINLIQDLRQFITAESAGDQEVYDAGDQDVDDGGDSKISYRNERIAVTWRLGVLVVRYLGDDTERARTIFTQLWQILRPALTDREACIPRIWMT